MQEPKTYTPNTNFGTYSYMQQFCMYVLIFLFSVSSYAQTTFEGGDIAILGVNANNNTCSGASGSGEDVITFVTFKDLNNGTQIDFTDNGWERAMANRWGDSEGTLRFTYSGGGILAGTSFDIIFGANLAATQASNPSWTISDLNNAPVGTLNMNSGGDQLYIMQDGTWDNMGITGDHDATYTGGRILYGFNTRTVWAADGTSQQSNLHPEVDPCYFMNPTGGTTNYTNYTGPMTPTTQLEWINRISNPANWTSFNNCTAYNNNPPPSALSIAPSGMSIECAICSGCGTVNDILTFNLPTTGGPFNVVYTDGTNDFNLNNINDLHTVNVSVSATTTYSLVSVTDINGCPVFSNFDGEATISLTGSGGTASITGGGVICTGDCSDITINVSGGQAPYDVEMELDFPPFVNNFQFDVSMPTTNLNLTICVDGLLPDYDAATNTLTIPDFIGNNVTISLISVTDNAGCVGTIGGTPLNFDIQQTPTANPAGPLQECDNGSGQASFDLSSLNNTVNGGSGNTVNWFMDMATTLPINTPGNYVTGSTTVYATTTLGDCDSDPVAVTLTVTPSPTANPTSAQACADGSGFAVFDLTTLDAAVNGGSGNTVSWYLDINGSTLVPNPSNFNTNGTTVYATVSAGICESGTVAVILTVNPAPIANPANAQACDEGNGFATFNLTDLDIIINGGTGNQVNWYSDPAGIIPIANPAAYISTGGTVYAVVSNGLCSSPVVAINLSVDPSPIANTSSQTICDDGSGSASFNLTLMDNMVNGGSGNTVNWYLDAATNLAVPNPTNFISPSTTVWATVSNGICSSTPVEVFLIVSQAPSASPTTDQACDDGTGVAIFNLNDLNNIVNQGTGLAVSWYFDMAGTAQIPDPANYSAPGGSVYAAVSDGNCSSQIVEILLTVNPSPTANTTMAEACDDGTGTATFNLTDLDEIINGNTGLAVSWYFDINGNFSIADPANFDITNDITVYANTSNGLCSSEIVAIPLTINPIPAATTTSDQACDEGNGTATFDLTSLENDINNGTGYTVSWFEDMSASISINNPANYTSGTSTVYAYVSLGTCNSEIVAIDLTVNVIPDANTTSTEACDEGNGTATFDLDALVDEVNGGNGNTVLWYEDSNANTPISSPYTSGTTDIYAIVDNGNCQSEVVTVSLNISDAVIANPAALSACDEGNDQASFDLDSLEPTINGGTANAVNFFEDLATSIPVSSPYTSGSGTIYAVVGDGICASAPVEIELTVNPIPDAAPASDELCDEGGGMASFDLTSLESTVNAGTNNNVSWFEDINGTVQINSPYQTGSAIIYAIIDNGNCSSVAVATSLTVNDLPDANPTSADNCDQGNGTASFDLISLENTINGGTANTVNFFEDANATIPVASPFNTTSTTIYAVVGDGNCLSQAVEVQLNVGSTPSANPTSADNCDQGNGTASFDLNALENTINGGTANTVNFFEDANATIPVASPFNTTSTTIYAVVGDGNCLSQAVEVQLNVGSTPSANPTSADNCDQGNGTASFDLNALENTINGGTANSVNFFEDANATIPITSPFNTASTTIYAVVGDGNCLSQAVEVQLNVGSTPSANPTSADNCDQGNGTADFDLNSLENTINGGTANSVNFFEDSNATIPVASPFNTTSTTIYAVVGDGNCLSQAVEVQLNVGSTPSANPTSADNCDQGNGTASFDLSSLENTINGGTANTVNFFEDANATIPVSSPFNTTSTTIYAVVGDGNCLSQAVEVQLNVGSTPSANPTSADNCDQGNGTASFDLSSLENTINGGTANTVNFFEDANATIPVASPFNTTSTTIYAVVGDGNCLSQAVEVQLNVGSAPSANPTSADNCDQGNGTASFDLSSLENTINGGTANTVNFFEDANATIPVATPFNTASTTIYAVVGDGNCLSQAVEVQLNVGSTPSANPTSADNCDQGNGTASFDLNSLENTINGGTANSVNFFEDANATIPVASPFNTASTTIYAVVGDGNCLSQAVEVQLNVGSTPSANPTSADNCDQGNGTASFDLNSLEATINGGTANTVNFFEDANATIPVASPFNTPSTTIYAVVGDGNCLSQAVEVQLNVGSTPTANPTSADNCDQGNGTASFDLNSLENTINGGTANTVNFFEDVNATIPVASPFNTPSTTIYAVVGDGNCLSQAVEVQLNVGSTPSANPTSADNCDQGNGTASFDLNALEATINGGTANSVNFFEDANATMPVSSPFNTASTTIYAVVGDGNCLSQAVEVQLNVGNTPSANPTSADNCDQGNGTADFDLSALENTINGGTANSVNFFEDANATIPVASPFNTASTTIYAVVGDGNCLSQAVEVQLNVDAIPTANTASLETCTTGGAIGEFNLATVENEINSGSGNMVNWYEDINATMPINDLNYTSFAGTIYAEVENSAGCVSELVAVSLFILLPSESNYAEQLCEGESVTINGTVYDINNPFGTETIVGAASNGCDSIVSVALNYYEPVFGSISGSTIICDGQNTTLTFNLSGANTFNVLYTDGINGNILLPDISDGHSIIVSPSITTTYTLLYVEGIGIPCTPTLPSSEATITITNISSDIQLLSDYNGFAVSCNGAEDGSIEVSSPDGQAPFSYQWDNGANTSVLNEIAAGSYTVTLTDANGCTTQNSISLNEPPLITAELTSLTPSCFGEDDGAIIIDTIQGPDGPFEYSLDGNTFSPAISFPLVIPAMNPGNYTLTIQDISDCLVNEELIINTPIEYQVNLGEDITINLGDSIQLEAIPNFNAMIINWDQAETSCWDCLDPFVQPVITSNYTITVSDTLGCSATDDIIVYVKKDRNVFIPTAFSPNDDGANDIFYINTDQSVVNISTFRIFNRWGETIFSKNNILPNTPSEGWDGTFKNKELNPGVFIYLIEIEFADGRTELYKGDITLLK